MSHRILLIEDETDLADNIKIFLENNNYQVIVANDGSKGIEAAKNYLPDLIICDIMMPYLDGYGVLRALLADSKTSIIPFIFLTARAERIDFRKGMNMGADDYLSKPFTIRDLLAAIETRLKKSAALRSKVLKNDLPEKNKLSLTDNILFRTGGGKILVKVEQIMYICAERQYTTIVLGSSRKIVVRKALNKWEQSLPENDFIRVSRSVLLNVNFISKIVKTGGKNHTAVLSDGSVNFPISRRYIKRLSASLKQN